MNTPSRTFEDSPAVRRATPLWLGNVGPSGTGKTFSALRLATGVQRVCGGDIFFIDTEGNRALHYADKFRFRHLPFAAPFGSLDYLSAVEHCVSKGAKNIVIDSMSHEHEGSGGMLESHEAKLTELAGDNYERRNSCKMLAWQKPKANRRRLINTLLQINCNFIFCFRAKEKVDMNAKDEKGKRTVGTFGYMPIAGEEFVYEMTAKFLLLPGADGFPTWNPEEKGEKAMVKQPEQFRGWFKDKIQLSEDLGQKLAEWAAGSPGAAEPPGKTPHPLIARYAACSTAAELATIEIERKGLWDKLPKDGTKPALKAAADAAAERLKSAPAAKEDRLPGLLAQLDALDALFDFHQKYDSHPETVEKSTGAARANWIAAAEKEIETLTGGRSETETDPT